MDNNAKEYIKTFISKVLSKSNIANYKSVDLEDDDINYIVTPKLNGLRMKNNIKLQFILYCSDENSLTLYCPILYKIKNNDSVMYTLNTINAINSKMAIGKIYLNHGNGSVVAYINRILFTNITSELTPTLLDKYIQAFLLCSLKFYREMKVDINEE